jgi:hypothetical protein
MRRDKKKKLARNFTMVTAVLLLVLFIVRDVLRENWKDAHDSVVQAKALYEIRFEQRYNDSAARSEGQSFENLQRKFSALQNPHVPPNQPGPWKPALASDIADLSNQAPLTLVKAEDELDFVSELIDALPSSAKDFRNIDLPLVSKDLQSVRMLRDEYRVRLEQDATSLPTVISPIIAGPAPPGLLEPEVDSRRAWELFETIYTHHGDVTYLGVLSVRAANHALELKERQIRICSYVIYALSIGVLVQGIYAARRTPKSVQHENTVSS